MRGGDRALDEAAPEPDFACLQDHDDFGSNRSKVIVIGSNKLERDSHEKPVSTFSHPALAVQTRYSGSNSMRSALAFVASKFSPWSRTLRMSPSRKIVGRGLALLVLGSAAIAAAPVRADFRLCNMSENRVSVAIAYTDGSHWVSEGWWNLKAGACDNLVRGSLASEYYYVTRWTSVALNGRVKPSCVRPTTSFASPADRIVSFAVSTGPAFSRSTPDGMRAIGPCN